MRFFRLTAITVLLVACVVMGSACAGAKGEQGPQGETGAQGLQGVQGIQGPPGTPGIGVEWVGEWDSATLYAKYDAVGYQGSSYISRQNSNTNNLPTDPNWWDVWVEKGDTGSTGADGLDGAPGPNMIVAMGVVLPNGTLVQSYNVTSCVWDAGNSEYLIQLTGITFDMTDYVVLVTPAGSAGFSWFYIDMSGSLAIGFTANPQYVQCMFSFVVLECP